MNGQVWKQAMHGQHGDTACQPRVDNTCKLYTSLFHDFFQFLKKVWIGDARCMAHVMLRLSLLVRYVELLCWRHSVRGLQAQVHTGGWLKWRRQAWTCRGWGEMQLPGGGRSPQLPLCPARQCRVGAWACWCFWYFNIWSHQQTFCGRVWLRDVNG